MRPSRIRFVKASSEQRVEHRLHHRRADLAGGDRVHAHAIAPEVVGERAHQRQHAALRGGVGGIHPVAERGIDRGDADHGRAGIRRQVGADRLHHEGQRTQVDVEHGIPLRDRELLQRDGQRHAGGVHEPANGGQRGARCRDGGIDAVRAAQVDAEADGWHAEARGDVAGGALGVGGAQIPDRDRAPDGGECLGRCEADAGGAAGDDHAAARRVGCCWVHEVFSMSGWLGPRRIAADRCSRQRLVRLARRQVSFAALRARRTRAPAVTTRRGGLT